MARSPHRLEPDGDRHRGSSLGQPLAERAINAVLHEDAVGPHTGLAGIPVFRSARTLAQRHTGQSSRAVARIEIADPMLGHRLKREVVVGEGIAVPGAIAGTAELGAELAERAVDRPIRLTV